MLHKHQAFFVFADFLLSVLMVVITVLALTGHFNKVVEVNSCKTPAVVVLPSPVVVAEPSPSSSASAVLKNSLRKPVASESPIGIPAGQ